MNNALTDEELERCTLTGRREIVFQLRSLIKRGDRLSVIFDEGRQSFLTILLDVSEKDGLLYFDVGGSEEINRTFLKADHSTFQTYVDGIRIQFSAKKCREISNRGEHVFAVPIPKQMLRMQRRDVFRIPLPTVKPFTCCIRSGTPQEDIQPLHDISIGGIGLLSSKPLGYTQHDRLEDCLIDLHEYGTFRVTLEVRYVHEMESRFGKPLWHMGCMFIDIAAANEMVIQRFMARLEVERRSLAPE